MVMHEAKLKFEKMKKLILPMWMKPMLLIFTLLFSGKVFSENGQRSIFDLMQYKEVLELTLETDFTQLKNNRRSDDSYKAQITFKDEAGKKQVWDLKVKVRGAFRRIHCSQMPPLKLNFKKSDLKAAGLADFDDMKLVPYCMGSEDIAKDALLREYLTYKLFNEITDVSFRVQLLNITYKDSETGEKVRQWAFIIEDTAELRDRIGAEKVDETKIFNLPAEKFERDHLRMVSVFQYMIGNADWGIGSCKNLKVIEKGGKLIAVPYDFDFSALVNAPYFAPDANYGLTSRDQRIFLGFPEDLGNLSASKKIIAGKRQNLEATIKNFKLLSPSSRKDMLAYLAGYFDAPTTITTVAERIIAGTSE